MADASTSWIAKGVTPWDLWVNAYGQDKVDQWVTDAMTRSDTWLVLNGDCCVLAIDDGNEDEWFIAWASGDLGKALKLFPYPRRWLGYFREDGKGHRHFPFDKVVRLVAKRSYGQRLDTKGAAPAKTSDTGGGTTGD